MVFLAGGFRYGPLIKLLMRSARAQGCCCVLADRPGLLELATGCESSRRQCPCRCAGAWAEGEWAVRPCGAGDSPWPQGRTEGMQLLVDGSETGSEAGGRPTAKATRADTLVPRASMRAVIAIWAGPDRLPGGCHRPVSSWGLRRSRFA